MFPSAKQTWLLAVCSWSFLFWMSCPPRRITPYVMVRLRTSLCYMYVSNRANFSVLFRRLTLCMVFQCIESIICRRHWVLLKMQFIKPQSKCGLEMGFFKFFLWRVKVRENKIFYFKLSVIIVHSERFSRGNRVKQRPFQVLVNSSTINMINCACIWMQIFGILTNHLHV